MTGEEEQEDPKEEQTKKKGGLASAMILVALGAAGGGAGMVLLTPPPTVQEDTGNRPPEYELFEHTEVMKFLVNPQTDRGGRITVRVGFRFVYKGDKHLQKKIEESIKNYWNKAFSRCLVVISSQDVRFLQTAEGKQALRKMLVDELTLTLFPAQPGFPDGIAIIDDILWTEYFLQ